MTDLIERLRKASVPLWWQLRPSRLARTQGDANLFAEAAGRILALESEVAELSDRKCEGCGNYMPRYCPTCTKDWQS